MKLGNAISKAFERTKLRTSVFHDRNPHGPVLDQRPRRLKAVRSPAKKMVISDMDVDGAVDF